MWERRGGEGTYLTGYKSFLPVCAKMNIGKTNQDLMKLSMGKREGRQWWWEISRGRRDSSWRHIAFDMVWLLESRKSST